ncbi:MAG: hypothetical protein HQ494_10190 [Rhodospirillales bacterium]|nr:hypothetical protein [Rhodospirillales bacterium]
MPKRISKSLRALVFAAVLLPLFPLHGKSIELGMTPSHVVSLWNNINNVLITVSLSLADAENFSKKIAGMEAKTFTDKKPADVLKKAEAFREKMNAMAGFVGVKNSKIFQDPDGGVVTPSVVYFNSGNILDTSVLLLHNFQPERLISEFYTRHDLKGKKPDDAFAMIDLADRRILAIFDHAKDKVVSLKFLERLSSQK